MGDTKKGRPVIELPDPPHARWDEREETEHQWMAMLVWIAIDRPEDHQTFRKVYGRPSYMTIARYKKWKRSLSWARRAKGLDAFDAVQLLLAVVDDKTFSKRARSHAVDVTRRLGTAATGPKLEQIVGQLKTALKESEQNNAHSSYDQEIASAEVIRRLHLKVEKVSHIISIVDTCLDDVLDQVKHGTVQAKMSDVPALIKARALLTGMPTANINLGGHVEIGTESTLIKQAKESGDPRAYVEALRKEHEEMGIILSAVAADLPAVIDVEHEPAGLIEEEDQDSDA